MEVWKIIFLCKWVICRFHVNLPGCTSGWNPKNQRNFLFVSSCFPLTSAFQFDWIDWGSNSLLHALAVRSLWRCRRRKRRFPGFCWRNTNAVFIGRFLGTVKSSWWSKLHHWLRWWFDFLLFQHVFFWGNVIQFDNLLVFFQMGRFNHLHVEYVNMYSYTCSSQSSRCIAAFLWGKPAVRSFCGSYMGNEIEMHIADGSEITTQHVWNLVFLMRLFTISQLILNWQVQDFFHQQYQMFDGIC